MTQDFFSLQHLSQASAKDLVLSSQQPARDLLSFEKAQQLGILPMSLVKYGKTQVLLAATTRTDSVETAQTVRFATGYDCKIFTVPEAALAPAIFEAYHRDGARLITVATEIRESELAVVKPDREIILQAQQEIGDAGKLLSALLHLAAAQEASDIQLSPRRDGLMMTLRIRGERRSMQQPLCSLELAKKLINRIKIISKLDPTQSHIAQDGSFELEIAGAIRSVRVSTLPTIHGAQVALRLFGNVQHRGIYEIFQEANIARLAERSLAEPSGLILLAGSTGSGKTTTLYSFMRHMVSRNLNVVSLEDPVEAEIAGVSQTSINPERGLTYAEGLKSALRQDPDVILMGEMRDAEVAAIACEAALTGHLVVSTMHAGNVREMFVRLQQLVGDVSAAKVEGLSHILRLMICQKLVPELCPHCRVLDLNASKHFAVKAAKAVGCAHCDYTGFHSRLCIAEALYAKNQKFVTLTQARIDELEAEELFSAPKKQLMRLFAESRIGVETIASSSFDSIWS